MSEIRRNIFVGKRRLVLLYVGVLMCAMIAMLVTMLKESVDGSDVAVVECVAPPQVEVEVSEYTIDECVDIPCDGDPKDASYIVVSKQDQILMLHDSKGGVICYYPVSVGRNFGNKAVVGDLKTPEGIFTIEKIHDASQWGHDSGDGNGFIQSCYGNWFLRLKTRPHRGIGIHASIRRLSIGKRASEGCVCLHSENLDKLRGYVKEGMKVIVETSLRDMEADGRCIISNNYVVWNGAGNRRQLGLNFMTAVSQDNVIHIVEKGDTYLSLAVKYGTTRKNIELLNPNVNPDELAIGQSLRVKGDFLAPIAYVSPEVYNSRAMVNSSDTLYYEATAVDNIGRIAAMYSTTRDRIIELNPDIDPDNIVSGQVVRVW